MSQPGPVPTTEGHRAWLTRMVARGRLIGLPPYRPPGGEFAQRPDRYARRLIEELEQGHDPGREAAAFQAWVESRPRPHPWTARSHIDLDAHAFESLRHRGEIHRALESIAHSDGSGPVFEATPPPSPAELARLRQLRRARRSRRMARRLAENDSILIFVILALTSMAFVGIAVHPGVADLMRDATLRTMNLVAGFLLVFLLASARKALVHAQRSRIAPKKPLPKDDWSAL